MRTPAACHRGESRKAFTLTELLTVIAIIGLLMAILLPAVQAVRETGRRATCTANLAQIGKAIQSYETANGHFPPGAIGTRAYSWIVLILPQLDQQATYDAMKGIQSKRVLWAPTSDGELQQPEHKSFHSDVLVCPTNPRRQRPNGTLQSSYVAVNGATDSAFMNVTLGADRCRPFWTVMWPLQWQGCHNGVMSVAEPDGPLPKDRSGAVIIDQLVPGTLHYLRYFPQEGRIYGRRADQVLDGLSNCMLVGEQSDWGWLAPQPGQPPVRGYCSSGSIGEGWWRGVLQPGDSRRRAWNLTTANKSLGSRFCDSPIGTNPVWSGLDNDIGFFSAHGPGASFVFGDGSVRWLDETIDIKLYQRLAIRDTVRGAATLPDGGSNTKVLP
jgi:prepilin-type N-terminal cleavage/methylation domain-containing protein